MVQLTQSLTVALLALGALAHPGGNVNKDLMRRQAHLDHPERRTLASCKRDLEASGWVKEQAERRHQKLNELRIAAGSKPLSKRDSGISEEEFGKRASCVLDPEQTEGPYWVSGELIRSNVLPGVKGTEKGVVVHLDINVIDVTTCKPIPNVYVELWGCNSTGVYTGVVAKGNGDGSASEINNNALRGLTPTLANGTAQFISVIPGHYVGRVNHLHTIIHHGATLLPNNTISGGTISHVGQFYIESSQMAAIEKVNPYSTNKQAWTQNAQDPLYNGAKQGGDDPTLKISMLTSNYADGVYAYIDVGVNPKAVRSPKAVNMWTANGGIPIPGSPWAGYPWTKKARELIGM